MRRLLLVMRFVGYLVAAGVSAAAGLQATGIYDPGKEAVVVIVAGAAITFLGSVISLLRQEHGRRRDLEQQRIRDVLFPMFRKLVDRMNIDAADLGTGAYRIRKRIVWQLHDHRDDGKWGSKLPVAWRSMIVTIDRSRPLSTSALTYGRWFAGMGVIGECIARGDALEVDVPGIYKDNPPGISREEWLALDADDRMGMTFAEWENGRNTAVVVKAVPIISDHHSKKKILGCIAIDAPAGNYEKLLEGEVEGAMVDACTAARNILDPLR